MYIPQQAPAFLSDFDALRKWTEEEFQRVAQAQSSSTTSTNILLNCPENYGINVGTGDATIDTAAWNALATTIAAGSGIVARGTYRLTGVVPSHYVGLTGVQFNTRNGLQLDLIGATFYNESPAMQSFAFFRCNDITVRGGSFNGYAGVQIDGGLVGDPDDWQPLGPGGGGGSYVGASYLFFEECLRVTVRGVSGDRNAGHDIFCWKSNDINIKRCWLAGIGSTYIDPINNGSDFGIVIYPSEYPSTGPNVRAVVSENHVWNHAFGVMAVAAHTFVAHGNSIGPCPGQHGIYGIELDAVSVIGNHFFGCYQFAFKNQLENYAGTIAANVRWVSDVWASGQAYHVGDLRITASTAWECLVNHTSGSDFVTDRNAGKWRISPLMYRKGGVVSGNTAEGCGSGFGVLNGGGLVTLLDAYVMGLTVTDNIIMNGVADGVGNGDGLRLDRVRNATITNNTIINMGQFGINCSEFGGNISGNTIIGCPNSAMNLIPAYNLQIRGNNIENCAQVGGSGPPIIVGNWSISTAQPTAYAALFVTVEGNTITYMVNADPSGDTTASVVLYFDTKHRVSVFNNRTNSLKPVQVNGSLLGKWGNNFSGFVSGAQQSIYTTTYSVDRVLDTGSTSVGEVGNVLSTFINEAAVYGGFQ